MLTIIISRPADEWQFMMCAKNIYSVAQEHSFYKVTLTYQHCTLQPHWQAKRAYFVGGIFLYYIDGLALSHILLSFTCF